MKRLFWVEWKRSFRSTGCKIGIISGIALAVAQAVQYFIYVTVIGQEGRALLLTESYLGEDLVFVWHELYCWLVPIIAALPFASSYYRDAETEYLNQLITRKSRGAVYSVRYIVTFLSGMCIVMLPLVINLILMAVYLPVGTPKPYHLVSVIGQTAIMGELHYTNPLLYTMLFWIINALFGGMFACVSLTMGLFIKNSFYIVIIPSFVYVFGDLLAKQNDYARWSVLCMIDEAQNYALDWFPVICVLIGVSIVTRRKWNKERQIGEMIMEIRIVHYTKNIKKKRILEDVSLWLTSGKIYGFRGANGSGKTMLMRAIAGLIYPSSGKVYIDDKALGKDISLPPSIGILIENPAFLGEYSGYSNLKMLSDISCGLSKQEIEQVLSEVGLLPDDKRLFREYSLGMKQKLGIAAAIMGEPDIILLDEPINALDEKSVANIKRLLIELRKKGKLIIVACHDREELNYLSDEIYVMENGCIVGKDKGIDE